MIMIAVAVLLSLVLCLLFGVPYIDFLRKKTIGQYILDVAPEAHAQKAGTPTTGGVFIILAIIISSVITLLMAQKMDNSAWIILITLFFMALAGFQDDYLYNVRKVNFSHIEYIDCIDLIETELWHASQNILEENTSRMDIRKD